MRKSIQVSFPLHISTLLPHDAAPQAPTCPLTPTCVPGLGPDAYLQYVIITVAIEASKFSLMPNESFILILIMQPPVFDKHSKRELKMVHNEYVHRTNIVMEIDSGTKLTFL